MPEEHKRIQNTAYRMDENRRCAAEERRSAAVHQ